MALDLSALDDPVTLEIATAAPLMLAVSLVDEDVNNPRTKFDPTALAELAEDIKVRGILQPLVVRPAVGERYTLCFGARRLRAAKLAGLTEIPYHIAQDKRQLDSYAQVAENHQREGLTPSEYASFIAGRLAAGERKKDIAAKLQISASALTYYAALNDAPPFLMEIYHARKCTTPEYLYRLRNLHNKHPQDVEQRTADALEITRAWLDELTDSLEANTRKSPAATTKPAAGGDTKSDASASPPAGGDEAGDEQSANYKIIVVKHKHRPAHLNLHRRASATGWGWIKYLDDGTQAEVALDMVVLDSLIES